MAVVKVMAGVMLFIALAKLPYGYYTALRWVVTISAVICCFHAFGKEKSGWGYIFIAIAVLFNPLLPIYLNKGLWSVIDIGIAIVFFASISAVKD